MRWKPAIGPLVSAAGTAAIAGVVEFVMTGGESTWIPLWAGLAGVIGWFMILWLFPSIGKRLGLVASAPSQPELWHASPGAGRLVARAIREADSLEAARAMFDAHYASPNRHDTPTAAVALAKRMEAEGEDSTMFMHKLYVDGIDLDAAIAIQDSEDSGSGSS